MAKGLRLFIGAIILVFPTLLGWYFRSPLLIPLLGALYVPLYFLGKTHAWQAISHLPSRNALLRAVPVTFAVQCVLVGVLYLIGLGLGTLFTDRAMAGGIAAQDIAWLGSVAVIALPISAFIVFTERDTATPVPARVKPNPEVSDKDDFVALDREITPQTFYRGPHFSRPNYARTAMVDVLDHSGAKPKRAPKAASAAMLAQTEERLGVKLPQTLREIYLIQDGGALPTYFVPKYLGAPKTDEGWVSAFAHDYNDLRPLAQLASLYDDYIQDFDPEYSDPAEKDAWIPSSEKLIILTARSGYGTALDYRSGPEPGVLLFDNNHSTPELKRFETFDEFFAALREINHGHKRPPQKKVAYGTPPDPLDADRFWSKGNAGDAVTELQWENAGAALGVTLPSELLPFYKAADGGTSRYHVALAEKHDDPPLHVFPKGPYVYAGLFCKVDHFISLATLSDRLDFVDGRTPWRMIFDNPERLIVISAAFDAAILLDYRKSDRPAVLAVPDLDNPDSAIAFSSVKDFLSRLRLYGKPKPGDKNEIGDDRISARSSDTAGFWMPNTGRAPVDPTVVQAFIEQWDCSDHGLPKAIDALYARQDGGAVRFRFAPPQTMNPAGHAVRDFASSDWVDVFPDGLLPIENWQPFEAWRTAQGLAIDQSAFEFTARIDPPYDDDSHDTVKLGLFVIGDHTTPDARMVTLLDMSRDFFNRNRHILTLKYTQDTDRFEIFFGPVMSDNIHTGLHQTLKARKSDL